MDEFEQSVMVALLPTTTNWCKIDFPHVTIIYAGEIPELNPSLRNDLAKQALSVTTSFPPLVVDVLAVDEFGSEEMVDVLLLRPTPELNYFYNKFKMWDNGGHPTFKPHATIGPMGSAKDQVPNVLILDRICVSWGKENLVYALGTGERIMEGADVGSKV